MPSTRLSFCQDLSKKRHLPSIVRQLTVELEPLYYLIISYIIYVLIIYEILDACYVTDIFNSVINFCAADYNILTEDKTNYTYGWKEYNASYKPMYSFEKLYKAFQYRTASDLNGYPVVATYNSYWGGGYVYEMRGQKMYLQGNITLLQTNNWIDRNTRAVIVEFSVFNPNINLISVAEMIIEFLPTGTLVASARFYPINLFTSLSTFTLVCDAIYLLFIIYYTIQEIRQFYKKGRSYLLQFWTLVEWAIIIFSWTALGLFIYKLNMSNEVAAFFKKTNGYGYYKLQSIAFWNLVLNYLFAFSIALGTLKFLKIFRFNNKISYLGLTLGNCASELIGFCLVFVFILLGFVQLFYLNYEKNVLEFSSFIRSITTCFDILLGKFHVQSLMQIDSILGLIYYSIYNILVIFVLLTIFISIINDSFKKIRETTGKHEYDYNLVNFFRKKFSIKLNKVSNVSINNENANLTYRDHSSYFADQIDELLNLSNEVRNYCNLSYFLK